MTRTIEAAVELLTSGRERMSDLPTVVGLDGFVDSIIRVVDRKLTDGQVTHLPDISAFADRVGRAAGKSTALELTVQQVKLGGNGPIMANAMASFGLPISYVGAVGHGTDIHPAFESMTRHCDVFPVCQAASTDALEFDDGKLMFQKMQCLDDLDYDHIVDAIGGETWLTMLEDARAVALNHWSSLPHMSQIWRRLQTDICPNLSHARRFLFFDLADPEKRSHQDVEEALELIGNFQQWYETTLGLNEKESEHICEVLGIASGDGQAHDVMQGRAVAIRQALGIGSVVVHPVQFAASARAEESAVVAGPYVERPLISTGAGDHFNAGYFFARLLGGSAAVSLQVGVATSGYYVRTAESPSLDNLVTFLKSL